MPSNAVALAIVVMAAAAPRRVLAVGSPRG